ncbi:MAG TPA: formate--phosphoribosylaminoimidazolecarboxamide ligase family protein [Thermoprotei archaeon]|nr:formate--phosphoribosylaminoimidazolecarboxamide ligase family protein [Thermoprotei archaeon]
MIDRKIIENILEKYGSEVSIGCIGSHSALDISRGAKMHGFKTIVVCQKGREKTYQKYFFRKKFFDIDSGCIDEVVVLEKFKDVLRDDVQEMLIDRHVIFIPHRSFAVYVGYDGIENQFKIPIFGNRYLLKVEERDAPRNQYYLLRKAGIRTPLIFKDYTEIDRVCIVKVSEAERRYERAFFIVSSPKEFEEISRKMVREGKIREESLKNAVIEEFIVGAQFNFNFFYSPLLDEIELMGIDTRRQTNLEGILRLPSSWQNKVLEKIRIKFIEVGHIACTLRESLLEKVFEFGERFIKTVKKEYPPGIIGPFALQGAVVPGPPREEIVIFDVSLRVPGSPGTPYTPYTFYKWGRNISVGERIAMEIKYGLKLDLLDRLVT